MRIVLVTNATQYAGPGAVACLLAAGNVVICQDSSYGSDAPAATSNENPNLHRLVSQSPNELHGEVLSRFGLPDAVVSNDVHPITRSDAEEIAEVDFRQSVEALFWRPMRIAQLFVPGMKRRRSGSFVFVTSAREARPEPGCALPTSVRAATTAFAKALAVEAAPYGLQVNVVAPNYLESEMYYPHARYVDDPNGRQLIQSTVPAGRLGRQEEVGQLIEFLTSGRSGFVTGQVVRFTGGWST